MNKKNLQALIDHLEKMPGKAFNLSSWYTGPPSGGAWDQLPLGRRAAKSLISKQEDAETHQCGTAACIGGYAALLAVSKGEAKGGEQIQPVATRWLGFSPGTLRALFIPRSMHDLDRRLETNEIPVSYSDVKRKHAVKVLKHLLDTGLIDWSKAGWSKRELNGNRYVL